MVALPSRGTRRSRKGQLMSAGLGFLVAMSISAPSFATDNSGAHAVVEGAPGLTVQGVDGSAERVDPQYLEWIEFEPAADQVADAGEQPGQTLNFAAPEAPPTQVAQAAPAQAGPDAPPEVVIISDRGGVLTPKGTFVIEPSLEYANTSADRLNFRGISIVEGFLIGSIDAVDTDRDSVTAAISARYGITNRFEVDVKVPYLFRDDRVDTTTGTGTTNQDLSENGLGDIEVAAHYQINDGSDGWPFFIANLRYKSNTGDGPFDIERDSSGLATELATGSGFHALEPSITAIYPTDPAVLFANVSYLFNFEDSVDKDVGGQFIEDVDPGDSVGISFGVGFALNEEFSLSFGYQHDWVFETDTEIRGVGTEKSDEFSVGSLLVGGAFRVNDRVGLNLTSEIGATDDAPDVRLILRVPIRF